MEPFSPATSINDARQRWLFRMVHTRRPLQEKMALFWHQHFATAYSKIANAVGGEGATQMMAAKRSEHPAGLWGQLELFRDYALPNFRDLLVEVAKDPAMLYWLDGRLNTRARPQENFAREVMELFTIGVGQFTESDVYAGARVFTGWNLQRIGERATTLSGSTSSSTTPRSTTRTRRRSASRSTPTGRRRFRRAPRPAGCRMGSTCSPRSRAIRKRPGGSRESCGRFSSARFSRLTRRSSAASPACTRNSDCHMAPVVRAVLSSREFDARESYFARYSWPVEFVARALKEVGPAGFTAEQRAGPAVEHGAAALRAAGRGGMGARARRGLRPPRCLRE